MRGLSEKYRSIIWAIKLVHRYSYVYNRLKIGKNFSFKLKRYKNSKLENRYIQVSCYILILTSKRMYISLLIVFNEKSPLSSNSFFSANSVIVPLAALRRYKRKKQCHRRLKGGRRVLRLNVRRRKLKRVARYKQDFLRSYKDFTALKQVRLKKSYSMTRLQLLNAMLIGVVFFCYRSNVSIGVYSMFSTKIPATFISKVCPRKKKKSKHMMRKQPFVLKPWWRLVFFIALWSLVPRLLTSMLGTIIRQTRKKRHKKNIYSFLISFKKVLVKASSLPVAGFKFLISGRLGGKLRKGMLVYKYGKLPKSTYAFNINYVLDTIVTQYGVFGLKLWMFEVNDAKT